MILLRGTREEVVMKYALAAVFAFLVSTTGTMEGEAETASNAVIYWVAVVITAIVVLFLTRKFILMLKEVISRLIAGVSLYPFLGPVGFLLGVLIPADFLVLGGAAGLLGNALGVYSLLLAVLLAFYDVVAVKTGVMMDIARRLLMAEGRKEVVLGGGDVAVPLMVSTAFSSPMAAVFSIAGAAFSIERSRAEGKPLAALPYILLFTLTGLVTDILLYP